MRFTSKNIPCFSAENGSIFIKNSLRALFVAHAMISHAMKSPTAHAMKSLSVSSKLIFRFSKKTFRYFNHFYDYP